mmetsp:Transcript_47856/g.104142  ORF Transcript_47856/g.104142 Transcript_47856/m.104142 type:complete len:354 (+) Transcript_47856:34-1095(+)
MELPARPEEGGRPFEPFSIEQASTPARFRPRSHLEALCLVVVLVVVAVTYAATGHAAIFGASSSMYSQLALGQCTPSQILAGCVEGMCEDGACMGCSPGFTRKATREGESRCIKNDFPEQMTFYVYRAQSNEDYPMSNNNAANLPGVLWYLQNEVVRMSCPRHYNITRIIRYKVTYKPTVALFSDPRHPRFMPFVAFDKARCTVPGCPDLWAKFGYPMGCQSLQTDYGSQVYWYSLPGPCPNQEFNSKGAYCKWSNPGGQCADPDGSRHCTWNAEKAGEITLDELSGIDDYEAFCKAGKKEFDKDKDHGVGMSFWDGFLDPETNAKRVQYTRDMFKRKFPEMPSSYPQPLCDG